MYLQVQDQTTTNQNTILRKERDVRVWLNKNLDGTEEYSFLLSPDGLGFRVGIRSIRAKALLAKLHAKVLPGFNAPEPWLEGHEWSCWFGYGPFLISTSYVFYRNA